MHWQVDHELKHGSTVWTLLGASWVVQLNLVAFVRCVSMDLCMDSTCSVRKQITYEHGSSAARLSQLPCHGVRPRRPPEDACKDPSWRWHV